MSNKSSETPWFSQSVINRLFFSIYDWFALGLHCRFIWQCPSGQVIRFYNQHISGNHLDIGVGTGYFLNKCRFPVEHPRLELMDINPISLTRAQKLLSRYQPRVHRRNVLEEITLDPPGFDSIGISHLLHCLPGDMSTKGIVFQNVLPLLNPSGVVFGNTFIYKDIRHSHLASITFWWANLLGFMHNKSDSLAGLSRNLKHYFRESHIEIHGCEAFFWARK